MSSFRTMYSFRTLALTAAITAGLFSKCVHAGITFGDDPKPQTEQALLVEADLSPCALNASQAGCIMRPGTPR